MESNFFGEYIGLRLWEIYIMTETLDVKKMLPEKFQPKLTRHFIVCLDGVDSFLFNSIERPTWEDEGLFGKVFGLYDKKLIAVIYNPIAPSGEQQLREWMMCQSYGNRKELRRQFKKIGYDKKKLDELTAKKRILIIKYLDPVGTVISEVRYEGVRIKKVIFSPLSYDNSEPAKLEFEMKFDKEIFEY